MDAAGANDQSINGGAGVDVEVGDSGVFVGVAVGSISSIQATGPLSFALPTNITGVGGSVSVNGGAGNERLMPDGRPVMSGGEQGDVQVGDNAVILAATAANIVVSTTPGTVPLSPQPHVFTAVSPVRITVVGADVSLTGDAGQDVLDGGAGTDVQIGDNGFVAALTTISLAGYVAIVGVKGSATIQGATADDSIVGGVGQDLLFGDVGSQLLLTTLVAGPGLSVTGISGDLTLMAGDSNDVSGDRLVGGADDDVLVGDFGSGIARLSLGVAEEVVIVGVGEKNEPLNVGGRDLIVAGAGNDLAFGDSATFELTLPGRTASWTLGANGGDDTLAGGSNTVLPQIADRKSQISNFRFRISDLRCQYADWPDRRLDRADDHHPGPGSGCWRQRLTLRARRQ